MIIFPKKCNNILLNNSVTAKTFTVILHSYGLCKILLTVYMCVKVQLVDLICRRRCVVVGRAVWSFSMIRVSFVRSFVRRCFKNIDVVCICA